MSVWFFLWFVMSATLLGFFFWSYAILFRQKSAWKDYAAKRKLRYTPGAFSDAPQISGVIDGVTVSLFPSEHTSPDARSSRKLTAMEVPLSAPMPFEGVVANGTLAEFSKNFNFPYEIRPKHSKWKPEYMIATDTRAAMEAYLTEDRLNAMIAMMSLKNTWAILIFRDETALLRFDTANPLVTAKDLDGHIKKTIEALKILELTNGESARLKEIKIKAPKNEIKLEERPESPQGSGLELEDE